MAKFSFYKSNDQIRNISVIIQTVGESENHHYKNYSYIAVKYKNLSEGQGV